MSDLNGNQPATRGDLGELKRDMLDAMERMETRLLTAFHDWARTYDSKARGMSSLVVTFEERLSAAAAADRLSRLERGEK